jgi:hypothetical protein
MAVIDSDSAVDSDYAMESNCGSDSSTPDSRRKRSPRKRKANDDNKASRKKTKTAVEAEKRVDLLTSLPLDILLEVCWLTI